MAASHMFQLLNKIVEKLGAVEKVTVNGILPVANGGTGNNQGKTDPLVHFYTGTDAKKQLDPYHISTGFYNIEQSDLGTGTGNYHRVIVLGDHQQTPTGYSTEIAFPYFNGQPFAPMMRCSSASAWSDWQKFYTTNNKPAIADISGLSDYLNRIPTEAELDELLSTLGS